MRKRKSFDTEQFLYGVCYFPEHWAPDKWEDDICRMKDIGMNVVRMGEGAWNLWEPEEGEYSFTLFDSVIALCEKHGMQVILGTPTYAPPAWLSSRYPEVLRKDFNGHVMHHGSRRHYNYTSPVFLEFCEKIVNALAEHYKDNPTVIGWQIDNEFNCHMDVSFADSDHAAFREWCRSKYGSLEALNEAWGSAFWAQTHDDWEQIRLPEPTPTYHNPSYLLDFYRFTSDSAVQFATRQYDILKDSCPHQFITHNGLFGNLDNERLTQEALDFMSFDSYPAFQLMNKKLPEHFRDRMVGQSLSRMRGLSEKFIILEQQAGPGGQSGGVLSGPGDYLHVTPKPGQMKLWSWHSIAHGADGVLFFRWRTCPFGAEMLWHGLNHYGNQPHWRLEEARDLGSELEKAGPYIVNSRCKPQAAMMFDYDNDSNCKIERYIGSEDWAQESAVYRALSERHLLTDIIDRTHLQDEEAMSRYPLLFYPNAQLLDAADTASLQRYVESGGTLVIGPRSGYKDRRNQCYLQPFPGVLRSLSGVQVTDFTMVESEMESRMVFTNGTECAAPVFNDILLPEHGEAEVLAVYSSDYYQGEAAVVKVSHGEGSVIYFGSFFNQENAETLLDMLQTDDPAAADIDAPKEIEIVTREYEGRKLYVLLNFSGQEQSVYFKIAAVDRLTERELVGTETVPPYGVLLADCCR